VAATSRAQGGIVAVMSEGEQKDEPGGKRTPFWKDSAELETYKSLVSLHNAQETIFWTRNNILAVIQSALVTGAFSVLKTRNGEKLLLLDAEHRFPATVLCLAGLVIAVVWILLVRRTDFLFKTTLHSLADMETSGFGVRRQFRAFGRFIAETRPDEARHDDLALHPQRSGNVGGWRLVHIWGALGGFFVLLWSVAVCAIWREYWLGVGLGIFISLCIAAFAETCRTGSVARHCSGCRCEGDIKVPEARSSLPAPARLGEAPDEDCRGDHSDELEQRREQHHDPGG
jgi:hypothetical protein